MYLFGFPEGLSGGSKETSYLTNYNTSRGTTRSTNFGTGWYTNRITSHPTSKQTWKDTTIATAWNSVGNTGWITTFDTGQTLPTYTRGIRQNIDSKVVGCDLGRAFWISNDNEDGVANFNCNLATRHWDMMPIETATDGGKFIDLNKPHNPGWYKIQNLKTSLNSISIRVDGVLASYPRPDYDTLYNANELICYIYASGWTTTGFYYCWIKLDNTRDTGSHSFPHFYPRCTLHALATSGSYNTTSHAIWAPMSVSQSGSSPIDENIPNGTYNTSWTTSGPMTYRQTSSNTWKNTLIRTYYSTGYNTGYGTSAHTSRTTSRGTGYTTTYGTSHTTDHITYG